MDSSQSFWQIANCCRLHGMNWKSCKIQSTHLNSFARLWLEIIFVHILMKKEMHKLMAQFDAIYHIHWSGQGHTADLKRRFPCLKHIKKWERHNIIHNVLLLQLNVAWKRDQQCCNWWGQNKVKNLLQPYVFITSLLPCGENAMLFHCVQM